MRARRPEEDDALAAFQDALVACMAEPELDAAARVRRLTSDPRVAPHASWVARFEERCVEVTATLMQRWGERDED